MSLLAPPNSDAPYLSTVNYLPPDQDQRVIRTQELFNQFAKATNYREIGIYETTEIVTGQTWFTVGDLTKKRNTFRKVFPFGAIVAGATLNIPHGIDIISAFTYMGGTIITAVPDDRPLPYVDEAVVTNQVSLKRNGVNIVIINGATAPNITSGFVILEYLKN